jgi:hypothetical protein
MERLYIQELTFCIEDVLSTADEISIVEKLLFKAKADLANDVERDDLEYKALTAKVDLFRQLCDAKRHDCLERDKQSGIKYDMQPDSILLRAAAVIVAHEIDIVRAQYLS